MMTLPIQKDFKSLLQFGLIGYGQWQVSDNSGSGVDPVLRNINYKVNGIGFGMNVILPPKGVTVGMKYFHEYGAEVNGGRAESSDHSSGHILKSGIELDEIGVDVKKN